MNTARIMPALSLVFVLLAVDSARATTPIVVNFDDLPAGENTILTGTNYAGLIWEPGGPGYFGNLGFWSTPARGAFPFSAPNDTINAWGCTQIGLAFPEPVALMGAYIAGQGVPEAWTTGLSVDGYLNGQLVGTTPVFTQIGATPTWFQIDLPSVDRVVFRSVDVLGGAGSYGMDDLTYTPLPEPATAGAFVLLCLTLLPRRRG